MIVRSCVMLKGLTKSRDNGERGLSVSFCSIYTIMRCFTGSIL